MKWIPRLGLLMAALAFASPAAAQQDVGKCATVTVASAGPTELEALIADAECFGEAAQSASRSQVYRLEKARSIAATLGTVTVSAPEPVDPYNGGQSYPAAATVSLASFDVPVGATEVHVPVTLDHETANTVIAYVRVYNGNGGRARPDTTQAVTFRPGDSLTKTVPFAIYPISEGQTLKIVQANVPDGGKRGVSGGTITAVAGAVNEPILDDGRDPLPFVPYGTLAYSATGAEIQFSDEGGAGTWISRLTHGRTQVGNAETGYYSEANSGVFERTAEGLVLKSYRLPEPVKVGVPAAEYPFAASMLAGFKAPELQFRYGTIEWEVRMPNRKGSWPALWLLPTGGWPPEIDVFEGFYYNGDHKPGSMLSTNLHGGDHNVRTFTRPMMRLKMSDIGLANTLDTEFHKFAAIVAPETITLFVDGVEVMQYANPFAGETWYPLMNVAVKAGLTDPYDTGSGDMTVRSVKIWRAQ